MKKVVLTMILSLLFTSCAHWGSCGKKADGTTCTACKSGTEAKATECTDCKK